jgi:ATP citrate (pro-S)-lyase
MRRPGRSRGSRSARVRFCTGCTPRYTHAPVALTPQAVQGMLDFDYCCGRDTPSVAGMIYPFRYTHAPVVLTGSGNHKQRFYWGTKEIMVPVYELMEEAMGRHPEVDVMINFASLRSAFDATMETLRYPQVLIESL